VARKNILLKSKARRERENVAAFLQELGEKLTRNAVVLQQGQQEIALDVPDTVRMKLNVKKKVKKNKTEHQLKITLTWTEGDTTSSKVTLG